MSEEFMERNTAERAIKTETGTRTELKGVGRFGWFYLWHKPQHSHQVKESPWEQTSWCSCSIWYRSNTRRSGSSPTSNIVPFIAASRVCWTMRQSASSVAWMVWNPLLDSAVLKRWMKRCLFCLPERNVFWASQKVMSPVKHNSIPLCDFLRQCVTFFAVDTFSYPSKTIVVLLDLRATKFYLHFCQMVVSGSTLPGHLAQEGPIVQGKVHCFMGQVSVLLVICKKWPNIVCKRWLSCLSWLPRRVKQSEWNIGQLIPEKEDRISGVFCATVTSLGNSNNGSILTGSSLTFTMCLVARVTTWCFSFIVASSTLLLIKPSRIL